MYKSVHNICIVFAKRISNCTYQIYTMRPIENYIHLWRVWFIHHQLGARLVLADTLADDCANIRHPGVHNDQLVVALVVLLDLKAVVLNHQNVVNQPLGTAVLIKIRHLALKDGLSLLSTGDISERLQELIDWSHPKGHMGFIAVGLAVERSRSLARHVADDEAPLSAILHLLAVVEPVRVALDHLDFIVVPSDVALLVIDLAVDGAGAVLDLAETLQLPGEVAGGH